MFEDSVPATTADLTAVAGLLGRLDQEVDDAERIDRIRLLGQIECAIAAARIIETTAFAESQKHAQAEAREAGEQVGRGVAAQVGLARRMSPFRARRYVGWARIVREEMPATFALMADGELSEWRAMVVARETAWLSREHRKQIDRELSPTFTRLGDRKLEAAVKSAAYRLDPDGYLERSRSVAADRCVTIRPAPDTMTRLTALLPVAQGVACYAALRQAADATRAMGDKRSRGAVMADTLVERTTGQSAADDVPVTVNVIVSEGTLTGAHDDPAVVVGHGPIPAESGRRLIRDPNPSTPMWLRRLFTEPSGTRLVTMESSARFFTAAQREFVTLRDQSCRTPFCDAPIRHIDHVRAVEIGGSTAIGNAQGLCEACNHAKQATGWSAIVLENGEVVTTTPTGHRYRSRAPDLPVRPPPQPANLDDEGGPFDPEPPWWVDALPDYCIDTAA